ncbi:hypothetical protein [Sutterella wadsworthensis]|uniref:hypothetical protein n=1 Tax=Sutterella wadsworthensis TaxID=40545 RepID=UPI003AF1C0AA
MNQEDKEELIEMIDRFFGIPRPILNSYCEGDAATARELLRLDMRAIPRDILLKTSRTMKNASVFMFFFADAMQRIAAEREATHAEA